MYRIDARMLLTFYQSSPWMHFTPDRCGLMQSNFFLLFESSVQKVCKNKSIVRTNVQWRAEVW